MTGRILAVLLVAVCLATAFGGAATADRPTAPAQPLADPLPDPAGPRSTGPGRLVTHDLRTGETSYEDATGPVPTASHGGVPGVAGLKELLGDPTAQSGGDKNFTFWSQVADPTSGVYPRQVRLNPSFIDNQGIVRGKVGSGTLIDAYHVLTAAHCVYQLDGSEYPDHWAVSITATPCFGTGGEIFGTASAFQLHAWSNYTDDADWDHDIAVITLDRPIGALTGWWGYGYNTDYDYYSSGTWTHAGYPSEDPFDGQILYENFGTYDETPTPGWDYRIGYFMPTWGGTSGAGTIRDGMAFGVFSGSNRIDHTEDVILTPTKYSHIQGWIAAVTPATYDLIPMYVKTDVLIAAGSSPGYLNFVLHNYGNAWANTTVGYTIYLSIDDQISQNDISLGSGSFTIALPNKHSQLVSLPPPTIPGYVAPGFYFMGVIIDVADWFDSNNDTSGQEAAAVGITCPAAPPAPTLTAPVNGATCRPRNDLYLGWGDLGSGDEYEVQVGLVPGTGTSTFVSNQTSLALSGLDASTWYYWRVRGRLGCGDWSPWSAVRSFRTVPNLNRVADLVDPAEGTHCLPQSVALGWTSLPDAASYEVQISPNWCYEGPITTGITGTQYTATGLAPNTTYYWRVRALTICGTYTDWSSVPGFCWTFKTAPDTIPVPHVRGPADGETCASSLFWDHVEDWDHYDVQVGTACGQGTIYTTIANGYWPDGLVNGETYVWRVRAVHECGLVSAWSDCRSFTLDQMPPTNPTTVASNSHQVGVWSADNTIDVYWDWGYDECSGSFPQYATLWDTIPDTEPTVPTTYGELTLETSPPLPDGPGYWFHLRTVDWAGNPAVETLHLGPFLIDATPPGEVANLGLCEPTGLPGDFDAIEAHWDAAADSTSGVSGYSWVVVSGAPSGAVPDATVETTALGASSALPGWGSWSFGVRAVDGAGNTGPVAALGAVLHDPNLPEFLAPVCATPVAEGQAYAVAWEPVSGATGGRLRLSTDGGTLFNTIASLDVAALAAGTWTWTVPAADTDEALLQLQIDYFTHGATAASRFFTINAVSGVPDGLPDATGTTLVGNYPNPFNPTTTIVYRLDQPLDVCLEIFDAAGHRVRRLVDGARPGPARHEVVWDGRGDDGAPVASGVYFCRLATAMGATTRPLVLLK